MITLVVVMLAVLVVAGLALGYVAFPHRGRDVPGVPGLTEAVNRAADGVPVLRDGDLEGSPEHDVHGVDRRRTAGR